MFGKKILLAVPHPDDEVVACAAAIARAQAQGARFYALYLTDGCIAKETLWSWQQKNHETYVATRRAEAESVATFLNIAPVGWSRLPARHLWRNLPQIGAEIEHEIAQHGIDQLWVPAYEGGNPDHDGLNAIGYALRDKVSVLEFAEYNFKGGSPQSQSFPAPNGTETVIELSEYERKQKRAALAFYLSEWNNLNYVKCRRETFRPIAAYDYNKPPHEGKLWYARFQWVPFRHPRVDFTKPKEVSAAIMNFLKTRTA